MSTFKDNAGRDWTVDVNVDSIKRVRKLVDVDLLTAVDGSLFKRLGDDHVLLIDVIYALCKPAADAANVTDEDFGRAMGGDVIEHATDALLSSTIAFFPRAQREMLGKIVAKMKQIDAKRGAVIDTQLSDESLDELIDSALTEGAKNLSERIRQDLEKLTTSSGSLPESSASTPAR